MLPLTTLTTAQSTTGAAAGSELGKAKVSRANYPLFAVGGVLVLIVISFLVAKMKRDDRTLATPHRDPFSRGAATLRA